MVLTRDLAPSSSPPPRPLLPRCCLMAPASEKGGVPTPPVPPEQPGCDRGMVTGGPEGTRVLPAPPLMAVTLRLPPITLHPLPPRGPSRVPSPHVNPLWPCPRHVGWQAGRGLLTTATSWQVSAAGPCNGGAARGEGRATLVAMFLAEPPGYKDVVPTDSAGWVRCHL